MNKPAMAMAGSSSPHFFESAFFSRGFIRVPIRLPAANPAFPSAWHPLS